MNTFGFVTLAAGALTVGMVGVAAPAMAAPGGTGSAQDTISSLQAEGYDVIVNRLSETPLDRAAVVSVGRGQSFTHPGTGANTDAGTRYGPVALTTVYVNVR